MTRFDINIEKPVGLIKPMDYYKKLIDDVEKYPMLINDADMLIRILYQLVRDENATIVKNNNILIASINDNQTQFIKSDPPSLEIISDIRIINNLIIDKVKWNPNDIHKLTPREFEQLAAELLEKQGYKVTLTQQTKDGGKDLIIIQKGIIGNFLIYAECKKYAPDNHIGVNLVRQLYGTVMADNATAGLMITSSYFSKDSYDFISTIKHRMNLVDFNNLSELLINS